ncbi:uncharacterized protein FFNC_15594 [Fusarium fujikuroi]
MQFS